MIEDVLKQALEAMNAMLTHMGMDEDEWNKVTFDQMRKAITSIRQAIADLEKQEPVAWTDELEIISKGIKDAIEEGGGFWRSCTGCYETNEGYPPNGAYFSKVFKCYLGNGCDECGGIGAIWDDTDYEEMAEYMMQEDTHPQPKELEQEPVALPDDFELLPVDPTPEMKSAAVEVELFDSDTGKDYVLSWEEAEQIYSAMLNAAPTPPQRKEPEQEISVAVLQAITNAGLTLLKTQHGYELRKLGPAIAHNIKE